MVDVELMSDRGADAVIDARGLTRRFGAFTAVDDIDISVRRGEVFGLLGANGAGKTTAIRMLCGLLAPTSGTVRVAGIDMIKHARRARGRIGYVAQLFALYADLTVVENLRLQAGLYGLRSRARHERITWALERMGLGTVTKRPARDLPLGYRRRLSLAAALLHEPGVLFLDEPTSGVDPLARQQFWELIYELAETGIGILVTTHHMDEALFCERLALMHAGRVIETGTPAALRRRPLTTPLLELRSTESGRWTQRLASWAAIREIVPHAGQLRLRLQRGGDAETARGEIERIARDDDLALDEVRLAQPELEDVFVAVLEEASTGEGET